MNDMPQRPSLRLVNCILLGFGISLVYSLLGTALVYFLEGEIQAKLFMAAYNIWFNTLISSGLLLGTAFVVFVAQNIVPGSIECAFTADQLSKSDYFRFKTRFTSSKKSVLFAAESLLAGFALLFTCQFPLGKLAEALMLIPSCLQYALGAYALRKLLYAGLMLHSLLGLPVTRSLSKTRELDDAQLFMLIGSILMLVSGYAHTSGYFDGPFTYERYGEGVKVMLAFPALIAGPMLALLITHARFVVGRIYRNSVRTKKNVSTRSTRNEINSTTSPETGSAPPRRFRVALSFAGEKRSYVAKVAEFLAARFGDTAILYDQFHEAEFARRDLGFYLPDLYRSESDLVVVVVCQNYEAKEWCGLEWDAIFDLLKSRKNEETMLCRFDRVLIRGLYSTAGFLELDDLPAEQAAFRILERLALNEGKPKTFYLSASSSE